MDVCEACEAQGPQPDEDVGSIYLDLRGLHRPIHQLIALAMIGFEPAARWCLDRLPFAEMDEERMAKWHRIAGH